MENLFVFQTGKNLVIPTNEGTKFVDFLGATHTSSSGLKTAHKFYAWGDSEGSHHDRPIIKAYNMAKEGTIENKYLCEAYAEGDYDKGIFLKSDCVKLFNTRILGRSCKYAFKQNPRLIKIDYYTPFGGKRAAYFLSYLDVAKSGIFKLGDSSFFPEQAREKYFTREALEVRFSIHSLHRQTFVSSGDPTNTEDIFKNLQIYPTRIEAQEEDGMELSISRISSFKYKYSTYEVFAHLTEENSVLNNWDNNSRILISHSNAVRIWSERHQRIEIIFFTDDDLRRLRRESDYTQTYNWINKFGEAQRINDFQLKELQHTGILYASVESAQKDPANARKNIGICPHCNNLHDLDSHDQEACRQRNMRPQRYDYHSQTPAHNLAHYQQATHVVGVEIEKEDFDGACYNHREIYDAFGWVKERDGSLDSQKGYELVSPMFDLYTSALIDEAKAIEAKYPNLINGGFSRACGGHIHYSVKGMTGREALEQICGYLPLIYAIYKFRTERTYCQAIEKEAMKRSTDKYQAVRIFSERIEFRIFPAVKNIETLNWRLDLLRIMAQNPTGNPVEVVNTLMDEASELRQLFNRIFDTKTIYKRAVDSLKMAKKYDANFYNIDFSEQIRKIETDAQAL
jgi:hypothetical protein